VQQAIVLETGLGVTQNFSHAAQLYREACEEKNGEGCARLATLYDKGAGVRRAPERAQEFRKRACDYGYTDSCEKPKAAT
jgi:hypothetical protein